MLTRTYEIPQAAAAYDPLKDYFDFAARPSLMEPDAAVTKRCPDVYRDIAKVCMRYPVDARMSGVEIYETPEVKRGNGLVSIRATIFAGEESGRELSESFVALQYRLPPDAAWNATSKTLTKVGLDGIATAEHPGRLTRAANMADLNFFLGIAEAIARLTIPGADLTDDERARRAQLLGVAPASIVSTKPL